jgi:hypothetical protein
MTSLRLQEIKERLPGRTTHEPLKGTVTDILLRARKSAAAAHGVHETDLGRHDPDWPRWYAEHITRTLGGTGCHLTGPSA